MRVREKPEGVLPAPAKEAPDESGAIEAGERPHRRTGDTREVLRLAAPPVNGTQAASAGGSVFFDAVGVVLAGPVDDPSAVIRAEFGAVVIQSR
jgi:hypothetical protein